MSTNGKFRKAREEWRIQDHQKEHHILKKRCETLRARIEEIENDLEEEHAPTEVSLRRDRLHGILYFLCTLLVIAGVLFLVELSLRTFLPQVEFPIWKQRVISVFFTIGIVISLHLLLENRQRGEPNSYRRLIWFAVVCLVSCGVLLSVIRGFLAGGINQSIDNLREIEWWSRWLGVFALVFMGIGLDIIAGLTGNLSWIRLTNAIPFLWLYKKRRRLKDEKALIEEKCIISYQVLELCGNPAVGERVIETGVHYDDADDN